MIRLKVVGYLRLSREDGDDESVSISNQRDILLKFAKDNGMEIDEFYIDDGVSGFTMDRPEFNRLKNDLNRGLIGTIIVKDLSRLSRHGAHSQLFLENIIESGKRLLTVHEKYDSKDPSTHEMVGIYAWINEKYIRDTSQKVRTSIASMQREGKYISSVPYGYTKDPINKEKYYIDDTCAMYVKQIFDMYINGMGCKAIAKQLTVDNVPTGRMIEQQRLARLGKTYNGKVNTNWSGEVVQRMIQNPFYAGDLVLNKTTRRSINGKKIEQPKEEHYVFKDAHEAIIDRATFELVQQLYEQRNLQRYRGTKIRTRPNIFSGLLVCADCGVKLTSSSNTMNTRYVCRTYNKYGTDFCKSHAVLESYLKESLITYLETCQRSLSKVIDNLDVIIDEGMGTKAQTTIGVLKSDMARVENEIKVLMESKMRELMKNPAMTEMIDNMYESMLNEKYEVLQSIKRQINDLHTIINKKGEIGHNIQSASNLLDEVIRTKELTKKQILSLVEKITVYEDGGLDIYLKGDLHELCDNKINVKEGIEVQMNRYTAEYLLANPNFITPTGAWKYNQQQGVQIGYIRYNKYFQKFIEDGMVKPIEGKKVGLVLDSTKKELIKYISPNNDANSTTWECDNIVTIKLVMAISEFGSTLSKLKKLF